MCANDFISQQGALFCLTQFISSGVPAKLSFNQTEIMNKSDIVRFMIFFFFLRNIFFTSIK